MAFDGVGQVIPKKAVSKKAGYHPGGKKLHRLGLGDISHKI
jgi:hypothetical protein